MHDETLKRIALTGTIIGLVGLFAIGALFPEEDLAISKIKVADAGKKVSLMGRIVDVRQLDSATILTIEREERIDIFVHSPINVSLGDTVRVRGEVGDYQGEKEIIVDQVHLVDSQSVQVRG